MYHNTNGSTYPACKPIPRATFFVGQFGQPWTATQRKLVKRRHNRKSRRFLNRQLRAESWLP